MSDEALATKMIIFMLCAAVFGFVLFSVKEGGHKWTNESIVYIVRRLIGSRVLFAQTAARRLQVRRHRRHPHLRGCQVIRL